MSTLAAPRPPSKSPSFRCIFLIDGYPYYVWPLKPHPEVAAKAFRFAGPEQQYDVHLTKHGPECECKGFLRHQHCKHVKTLQAFGCF